MSPNDSGDAARMGTFGKFSRGEPIAVDVERIERELAELWKEASRAHDPAAGDKERAVSRAALWNLVVPAHGQASLQRTRRMLDELAPSVPARAMMLFQRDGQAADGDGSEARDTAVRATIESNVVSRPSGTRVVFSEEITLSGPPGAEEHFGALVRALQIPGLPTATLWIDSTMPEVLLVRELLPATDRLVIDTGNCARPAHLLDAQRIAEHTRGAVTIADLGWLRLASFRLLFAGLFDPPVGGGPLRRARTVAIHHRAGADVSALLLAAWLGLMLGWRPAAAGTSARGGGLAFRFDRPDSPGAGPVEVTLASSPGECGTSGIVALELTAALDGGSEALYAVRRTAQNHAELTIPIAPPRVVKLDSRSDAELCVAALGPAGRDALLPRCLSYAARLCGLGTQA
jgi:glucose-6-phosphate dehydrogenase assembly protein OpcA